jgi:two-component system response regulator
MLTSGEEVDILVVEDNDSDRDSIVESLTNAIKNVRVAATRNGAEAIDFLLARGPWKNRAGLNPPKLILLDLEMVGTDGFSVLGQIRAIVPKDALTLTPVVMFTDSKAPGDITASYLGGANSYIIKPLSFPDFKLVVERVGQYWMSHNVASE